MSDIEGNKTSQQRVVLANDVACGKCDALALAELAAFALQIR